MSETVPPSQPPRRLHILSGWSLVLQIVGAISFTACFVIGANASKLAMQGWLGDFCTVLGFVIAPLCMLGALVTGVIGVVKSPGCLAVGIMILPLSLIGLMMLFCWLALVGASRFR